MRQAGIKNERIILEKQTNEKRPITAPCQKRGGSANMNSKAFNKHWRQLDRLVLRKPRLRQATKR